MADPAPHPVVDPERMVGERIAGRFVVDRAIGQGPLSSAFRAHDERLHRRVTVKLFHPRHRDDVRVVESQLAAARAVARLSHEHLAIVIDQGTHAGMPLVVFEYVRGENLHERIDRYAPLGVDEVAQLGTQIARALTYAHGHGVIHGNLRPENVLLTEERDVKLVDFGGGSYVAQLVGDPFAAPELAQVDPGAPAEPTDDVYALGAVLFVALTERAPRAGVAEQEILIARPDLSPTFARTIAAALAERPEDRFGSMRELSAELGAEAGRARHGGADVVATTRAIGVVDPAATQEFDVLADEPGIGAPPPRRPAPRARRARGSRERRARALAWSMVAAPLVALAIVGAMIAGEQDAPPKQRTDTRAAGPVRELAIGRVTTMDPPPGGDGAEREDLVANVIDGDTTTAWQTEGYDTESFAGLKPGVGLVIELAEPADVRDVQVFTKLPNWSGKVYAASEVLPKLDDWTPVSEEAPLRNGGKLVVDTRTLKLDGMEPGRTRLLLLWITDLALDMDDPSKFRARIGELLVHGATGAVAASSE